MFDYKEIDEAAKGFDNLIKRTPLEKSQRLSELFSANIFIKREDLQLVRSYKIRGAFNFISKLDKEKKLSGVVCASAGNHSQGVAACCNHFKIKGTIFMPKTTSNQKIARTKKFGNGFVEVVLYGDSFDDANEKAQEFCKKKGAVFVHPFDDYVVMGGQGTVAKEIIEDLKEKIDYVFVPVGGGGLIGGVSTYFKEKNMDTKIVAVEPKGAASLFESSKKGEVVLLEKIDKFVDGAAVKKVGKKCFELALKNVDEYLQVDENRLCETILDFLGNEGIILEPAGALAMDALKDYKDKIVGKNVVCILSGGNLDFDRLPDIKERALIHKGLKKYFNVEFPQRPGALREFVECLGENDDIVKFEYEKNPDKETGFALVGLETNDKENFTTIKNKLHKREITFQEVEN